MARRGILLLSGLLSLGWLGPLEAVLPGVRPGAQPLSSLGMALAWLPPGEFVMGSPPGEAGRLANEGPAHRVRITRGFWLGVHEVTVGEFRAFINATGYRTEAERDMRGGFGIDFGSGAVVQQRGIVWHTPGFPDFHQTDRHPVVLVSWADAEAFTAWLSAREGARYRLPTEAEWEYAARAGAQSPFWFGDDPTALAVAANTADASLRDRLPSASWSAAWRDGHAFTAPVGSYAPNGFGLHDMHGNVWEWNADGYEEYVPHLLVDPRGPGHDAFRSIRGGGWFNPAHQQRSATRVYFAPTFRYCLLSGFRVVREH